MGATKKPLKHQRNQQASADDQSGLLTWQAAKVGDSAKTADDDNGAALRRIKADLPAREAVRQLAKEFGMTVVTADHPADTPRRDQATGSSSPDSQS